MGWFGICLFGKSRGQSSGPGSRRSSARFSGAFPGFRQVFRHLVSASRRTGMSALLILQVFICRLVLWPRDSFGSISPSAFESHGALGAPPSQQEDTPHKATLKRHDLPTTNPRRPGGRGNHLATAGIHLIQTRRNAVYRTALEYIMERDMLLVDNKRDESESRKRCAHGKGGTRSLLGRRQHR